MEPNNKQKKERTYPFPKGFIESLNIREIIARTAEEEKKGNLKRTESVMITYLACPYSHKNKKIEVMRFEIANFVASVLMKEGEIVFSPISHTHPLVLYGLPGDWEFWKSQDTAFLNICTRFKIIKVDGWDTSSGVIGESKHMEDRGIEIECVDPYELEGFVEFMKQWKEVI